MKKWGKRRRRGRPLSTRPTAPPQCSRKKRNRAANLFFPPLTPMGETNVWDGREKGKHFTSPRAGGEGKGREWVQAARHQRFALSLFSSGRSCAKRSKKGGIFRNLPSKILVGREGGDRLYLEEIAYGERIQRRKLFLFNQLSRVDPISYFRTSTRRSSSAETIFCAVAAAKRRRKEINSSPEGKRGRKRGFKRPLF